MTITAAQVRQACALLGWKATMLSRKAKTSYKAAINARREDKISTVSDLELHVIRVAFEASGIIFIPANGEDVGVRLRQSPAMGPAEPHV